MNLSTSGSYCTADISRVQMLTSIQKNDKFVVLFMNNDPDQISSESLDL